MREELELPFERIFNIMLDKLFLGEIPLPNGNKLTSVNAFIVVKG